MKRSVSKRIVVAALALFCTAGLCFQGCAKSDATAPEPSGQASASGVSSSSQETSDEQTTCVYAGSRLPGTQNGALEEAQFFKPYGMCLDQRGALLVVDSYGNLLRGVDAEQVWTLAGDAAYIGRSGYPIGGYRDGAAEQAWLNRPRFATVSKEGAVVFSDSGNHSIRVLDRGQVYLLAGVRKAGYRDGAYDVAQFDTPSGVAIGLDGSVYVADTLNHCIRVVSPEGQVSTLTGSPYRPGFEDGALDTARFCEPNDLEIGPDGALYVVDKGNQRIRKIQDGAVTTVAGSGVEKDLQTGYIVGGYRDGAPDQAQFLYPTGFCFSDNGVLYVADTGNNCIRAVGPDGAAVTVAGARMAGSVDGRPDAARFNQPADLVYLDGYLYISDSYNHAIRKVPVDEQALF